MAWRRLWRRWPITLLAAGTLALAVGTSTAMFSVFYGLVQHPLPFPQSQRLVWLQTVNLATGRVIPAGFSLPEVLDYRARNRTLQPLAAFEISNATLVHQGAPDHVTFGQVSGGFFPALGVLPFAGRALGRADEVPNFPQCAVLSYGLWQQKFGGNPAVVGHTIDLDNKLLTIVGVMPFGFAYPEQVQVWLPEPMATIPETDRAWRHIDAFARLRPGITLAAAQRDLSAVAAGLAKEYPKDDAGVGIRLLPMGAYIAGPLAPTLSLMLLGVLLVLVLACANVGNLLLGAAVARGPAMALQQSLGARRRRLLGQLLAEGLWLAILATLGGWLVAWGTLPLVRHLQGHGLPQLQQIGLNLPAALFGLLLIAAMTLWFGLAPALELLRPQSVQQMVHGAGLLPRRSRVPTAVMVLEVALTVVLLVCAGLFWHTLQRIRHRDPGFRTAHVLTFKMTMLANSYAELDRDLPYYQLFNQRLQQLPGIRAAGMVNMLPLTAPHVFVAAAEAGTAAAAMSAEELPSAELVSTLPGYFRAMGIPLIGRDLQPADGLKQAPLVVVISASMAQAVFGSQEPLGRSLVLKRAGQTRVARVVGIAGDVPQRLPGGPPEPAIYMPLHQLQVNTMSAVVQSRGSGLQLLPRIRRISEQLNPEVALYGTASMEQLLQQQLQPVAWRTNLLAVMALLALGLAAAGLFGVVAHSVAMRRHEIGIRMALGASTRRVGAGILGQALRLTAVGMAAGLLLSWWLQGSLQPFLPAGSAGTAWIWVAVPVLVLAIGSAAALIPARRAARIDPAMTLRRN